MPHIKPPPKERATTFKWQYTIHKQCKECENEIKRFVDLDKKLDELLEDDVVSGTSSYDKLVEAQNHTRWQRFIHWIRK